MTGIGRGKGRGGTGRGRGNFQGRGNSGATFQPQLQLRVNTRASLETGESNNPCQEPTETRQISSNPLPRLSVETVSSRNLDRSAYPSPEAERDSAVCSRNKKRGRGKYKSKTVDIKTKYGGKITITIPDDIDRAVGAGARDIVNYCGLIMRSTISFQDGNWQKIVSKYGETMWLKVKDKFEVLGSVREHVLQVFVISTMQRLFRAWKARLSSHYSRHIANGNILSHRPEDVELEDWKYLVEYFGSSEFKAISERNRKNREKQITKHTCGTRSFAEVEESTKNPITGEKETPDRVWEIQHTRKNDNGEIVWVDPQSQQIHGQLQELVAQQQSEENEHPLPRDEILSSVLGERTGYVRGKGYGKKPPKKSHIQAANMDASVSSAMATVRQEMQAEIQAEMQAEMSRKLQEERQQMAAELKSNMEQELQRKLEEQLEHVNADVDNRISVEVAKRIQEQLAAIMTGMQQGQGS